MLPTSASRCQSWIPPAPVAGRAGSFEGLKLEVRSGAHWMRTAGSGRREQAFFNSVQAFPGGLSERRVGADDVADHLPGGEVERALRRRAHRQRNRALRAETDPLCRRFLARLYSDRLREQIHGNRFLSGLDLPAATKTIQVVQKSRLRLSIAPLRLLSPRRGRRRKYVEGFRPVPANQGLL